MTPQEREEAIRFLKHEIERLTNKVQFNTDKRRMINSQVNELMDEENRLGEDIKMLSERCKSINALLNEITA